MTRNGWVAAGFAAGVAAVLLVGAWLLLGGRDTVKAGTDPGPEAAATTRLSFPPDPSDGSTPPDPYPTVPAAQRQGEEVGPAGIRTGADGRRLLVQVMDTDCSSEEVRLLGEHDDRVEVEIRTVAKPPPPGVSVGPGGSYSCMGLGTSDGPYAVVDLAKPLGQRAVDVQRVP